MSPPSLAPCPGGLDAPLIMKEGGKTKNSSISPCGFADKFHGWKTLRNSVPGIKNLQGKSGYNSFRWKTLTQIKGGGGGMAIKRIRIIGGGLAGPEAALQAAKFGCEVDLYEMRPTAPPRPTKPPTSPSSSAPTPSSPSPKTPPPGSSNRRCAEPAACSSPKPTPPPSLLATLSPSTASNSPNASPPASLPNLASESTAKK